MKRLSLAVVLCIALLFVGVTTASAQQPAGADGPDSYTSGFQVQNLTATAGNVQVTFYNKDGSEAGTISDSISANGSLNYFPIDAVSSGFNGSAVVSSDVEVAAIVNVFGNGTAFGGGSYGGISAGATTVNVPLVIKNVNNPSGAKINTFFNIQNAGSAAASVTVTYPGQDAASTETYTIQPGAAAMSDQAANTNLPEGFVGSAVVTSDQPIVASVIQYDNASLLSNNGFAADAGSTNPVMPLIVNNFVNTFTGIQIQNTGATDTEVTLSYSPSAGNPGQACAETQTIAAGQSGNFGLTFITDNCEASGTPGFVGSAAVTANSAGTDLVAIVNQVDLFDTGANPGNASAYAAFSPTAATAEVAFPVIVEDLSLGAAGVLFTGFNLYNAGSSAVDVTCSYEGTIGTSPATGSSTFNVAAGAAANVVNTGTGGLDAGFVGSANCVGPAGSQLVGVANQVGGAGDSIFTYEGFNK